MRKIEDREALGQVLLGPLGELGSLRSPNLHSLAQQALGFCLVRSIEDGADAQRDRLALIEAGYVGLSILLEMELAALPGDAGKHGSAGSLETGMIIRDDELDAFQPTTDEAVEKGAPMDLRLGKSDRHADHAAPSVGGDAHRNEDGTVDQPACITHTLVAGIEEDVRSFIEGAFAPGCQTRIQGLRSSADLGGGDGHLRAEKLDEDVADLPGGDTLDIHFGKGKVQGLLGAGSLLQR